MNVIICKRISKAHILNKNFEAIKHDDEINKYCLNQGYNVIATFVNESDDVLTRRVGFESLCNFIKNNSFSGRVIFDYVRSDDDQEQAFFYVLNNIDLKEQDLEVVSSIFPETSCGSLRFCDLEIKRRNRFDDLFVKLKEEEIKQWIEREYYFKDSSAKVNDIVSKQALIYCRGAINDHSNSSLQTQELKIREYCRNNNINVKMSYRECASGISFERSEFLNMLSYAELNCNEVDLILITSWDVFSRLAGDAFLLIEELKRKGIEVIAINQLLDKDVYLSKVLLSYLMNAVVIENWKNKKAVR